MRMLRWLLCAVALACAPQPSVPVVEIAALPLLSGAASTSDGTLLSDCVITGEGERHVTDEEEPSFDIFASLDTASAAFVVARPRAAHVTWSHFPSRSRDADGRARVELGGQRHLEFVGYASLEGRTFSATTRMFAEPAHLWARAGAPIEMLAARQGLAIARVRTSFTSPKELVVRGACSTVAYEPRASERPVEPSRQGDDVQTRGTSLDLFASPDVPRPFTTITTETPHGLDMIVVERKDAFVRVVGERDEVGFDAWVPASQVTDQLELMGIGIGSFSTSSACGGTSPPRGVVAANIPLFVGTSAHPVKLTGANVEKGADVYFSAWEEIVVSRTVLVPFTFVDNMITPSGEERFWIARDAIITP
jgi:hypothetical protein